MLVQPLLVAHRGFPGVLVAPFGLVVMADEDAGGFRQCQNLLDRFPHRFSRPARKIAARRAEIGHEERVAHKRRVPDHIGQAGGRVAGRVQDIRAHLPDHQAVAFAEQPVELRAVALEPGAFVEDLAEGFLHHGDAFADPDLATQPFLDIGRGRQVVGMDMGFKDPFQPQIAGADEVDHRIGRPCVRPPRGIVEIQHRIDHRTGLSLRFLNHIGQRVGRFVEKGGDDGRHGSRAPEPCPQDIGTWHYIASFECIFSGPAIDLYQCDSVNRS